MKDSTYYRTVFAVLSALNVPATDTAKLRQIADIMDETATRGNAAIEAEQIEKDAGGDVA